MEISRSGVAASRADAQRRTVSVATSDKGATRERRRTAPLDDESSPPRDRAEALVAAMTLEQKIAQLHGAMETIDIYALSAQAAESGRIWTSSPPRSGSSGT